VAEGAVLQVWRHRTYGKRPPREEMRDRREVREREEGEEDRVKGEREEARVKERDEEARREEERKDGKEREERYRDINKGRDSSREDS